MLFLISHGIPVSAKYCDGKNTSRFSDEVRGCACAMSPVVLRKMKAIQVRYSSFATKISDFAFIGCSR